LEVSDATTQLLSHIEMLLLSHGVGFMVAEGDALLYNVDYAPTLTLATIMAPF
jgi:hypothetical protein